VSRGDQQGCQSEDRTHYEGLAIVVVMETVEKFVEVFRDDGDSEVPFDDES